MNTAPPVGLILAAGLGSRMNSELPKGLHPVCGMPMVQLAAEAMEDAGVQRIIIIVGYGGESIKSALGDKYTYVWQHEQLGTGHAALCAADALAGVSGPVLISPGDTPLLTATVFRDLLASHVDNGNAMTVATMKADDPTNYGRIVRQGGVITGIVECKVASPEQKEIKEVNAGVYCVNGDLLIPSLQNIKLNEDAREFYLTDLVEVLIGEGQKVEACVGEDADVLIGVNRRQDLAKAEKILREKLLTQLMNSGVTIVDPDSTYVGPRVTVGRDAVIQPNSYLLGNTHVGARTVIGPGTRLVDTTVGKDALVIFANAVGCEIGDECKVGPYANIRPGSKLGVDVNIGNFVEVNRSTLGDAVKARHLAYLGDSIIGARTNIGAGTITCNFDGFIKSKTLIGSDTFIGSNSTLIAPLTIGDRAMVTAGSVITQTIPQDGGAFGRARQITLEGWAANFRTRKAEEKSSKSD